MMDDDLSFIYNNEMEMYWSNTPIGEKIEILIENIQKPEKRFLKGRNAAYLVYKCRFVSGLPNMDLSKVCNYNFPRRGFKRAWETYSISTGREFYIKPENKVVFMRFIKKNKMSIDITHMQKYKEELKFL